MLYVSTSCTEQQARTVLHYKAIRISKFISLLTIGKLKPEFFTMTNMRAKSSTCFSMDISTTAALFGCFFSTLVVFVYCERLDIKEQTGFKFNIDPRDIFHDNKVIPRGKEMKTYLHKDRDFSNVGKFGSLTVPHDTMLLNKSSYDPITYSTPSGQAGMYMLDITSLSSDSYIRLFASSRRRNKMSLDRILPRDNHIYTKRNRRKVTIEWKPVRRKAKMVKYCVAANKKRNFSTLCGFQSYIKGDKVPARRRNAGFGFDWEGKRYSEFLKNAAPVKAAMDNTYKYKCIGNKTSYSLRLDRSGDTYYLNVYVVHVTRPASAAYRGTKVVYRGRRHRTRTLRDKQVRKYSLSSNRRRAIRLRFDLKNQTNILDFSVVPCNFTLRMNIFKNNRLLATLRTRLPNHLTLRLPQIGRYILKMSFPVNTSKRHFFVMTSTNPYGFGLPVIPRSKRVFARKTSCDSVTISWLATGDVTQRYCLYQEQQTSNMTQYSSSGFHCVDKRMLKNNRKISCKRSRHKLRPRTMMTRRIKGLHSSTTYSFRVFVTRSKVTVQLGSVTIRTKAVC